MRSDFHMISRERARAKRTPGASMVSVLSPSRCGSRALDGGLGRRPPSKESTSRNDKHGVRAHAVPRRSLLAGLGLGLGGGVESPSMGSQIALGGKGNRCDGIASTSYFDQGPYKVGNVKLEHTCSICFPKVVGDQLIIRAHIFYPQTLRVARALERSGCEAVGRRQSGPWPLAVISSGFLVGSDQYRAYAERLASYGYVAVLYDKVENINSTINDEVSSLFVTEIINWCSASPIFQGNLKTEEVYLIGHSRGGKVSLLAAEADDRVGAVLLLDPVDSNSYAPEGPGYPSAIRQMGRLSRGLPIAIVGGGRSGDCIPQSSNYERFFEGSPCECLIGALPTPTPTARIC